MDASESREKISMKLVVNIETNKVLFAEAGKDFVDVLISFLTLPLATIVRLVGKESDMESLKVGSLNSLYQSVANLDQEFLCTDTCKEMLLQPRNSMEDYCRSLNLNIDDTDPIKYFICQDLLECCHKNGSGMLSTFKNKKCSCGKFLSKPIFPQSSNVMDLLKCSLFSKTTLTDFFLEKKLLLEKYEQTRLSLSDFAASGENQIIVDVLYSKSDGKIIAALGKEDFADLLLSFLTFPLGGVVRLLKGYSTMGSVDGLYKSIVDLNDDYFKTKEVKDKLVDLRLAPQFKLSNQIIPFHQSDAPTYYCYYNHQNSRYDHHVYFLTSTYKACSNPTYERYMPLGYVDPLSNSESAKGFVKGPTMFMATDDLVVTPMSFSSLISLLNSMNTSINDLEGIVLKIGIKEGLSILKASLTSKSALTVGLGHLLTKVTEDK